MSPGARLRTVRSAAGRASALGLALALAVGGGSVGAAVAASAVGGPWRVGADRLPPYVIPGQGTLVVAAQATVGPRGQAVIPVSCTVPIGAACTGRLSLTALVKVKRSQNHHTSTRITQVAFGKRVYSVALGSGTVTIPLSPRGFGLLRAAPGHQLLVDATATSTSGYMAISRITLIARSDPYPRQP